jgi:hypothetical protein
MTTETFTESVEDDTSTEEVRVPDGSLPWPEDTEDSIGWVVEWEDITTKETRRGVVQDSTWDMVKIQQPGACPRSCCLDSVRFARVTFIGPVACQCGSNKAAVLCLCDEDTVEDPDRL